MKGNRSFGTPRAYVALIVCGYLAISACHPPTAAPSTPEIAESQTQEEVRNSSHRTSASLSLRNPNDGRLVQGVALPLQSKGMIFNPQRDPSRRFGTAEVVHALIEAAAKTHAQHGGLPLVVNDLSLNTGGPLEGHRSHQSGRDVDLFFYQRGPNGNPILPVGAFFDTEGKGIDFKDLEDPSDDVSLKFDTARVWSLLEFLLIDENASVQRIFIADHLAKRLLEHAKHNRVAEQIRKRFAEIQCQPPNSPHDDHIHLRFYCSFDDIPQGCRDGKAIDAQHAKSLRDAGLSALPWLPRRKSANVKTTSIEEARMNAGPMHSKVVEWLDRRQSWIKAGTSSCR